MSGFEGFEWFLGVLGVFFEAGAFLGFWVFCMSGFKGFWAVFVS